MCFVAKITKRNKKFSEVKNRTKIKIRCKLGIITITNNFGHTCHSCHGQKLD